MTITTATLFLAVFNTESIRSWADTLEPGPGTALVRRGAAAWHAVAAQYGLTWPRDRIRAIYVALRSAPEEPPQR